jgi:hypothetical protein
LVLIITIFKSKLWIPEAAAAHAGATAAYAGAAAAYAGAAAAYAVTVKIRLIQPQVELEAWAELGKSHVEKNIFQRFISISMLGFLVSL